MYGSESPLTWRKACFRLGLCLLLGLYLWYLIDEWQLDMIAWQQLKTTTVARAFETH